MEALAVIMEYLGIYYEILVAALKPLLMATGLLAATVAALAGLAG